MLARRDFLSGSAACAVAVMFPVLPAVAVAPIIDQAAARMWKLKFAAEFARAVDVAPCPNVLEMMAWITSEAGGAFAGLDDPLSTDPIEEAREAVYCIGACC